MNSLFGFFQERKRQIWRLGLLGWLSRLKKNVRLYYPTTSFTQPSLSFSYIFSKNKTRIYYHTPFLCLEKLDYTERKHSSTKIEASDKVSFIRIKMSSIKDVIKNMKNKKRRVFGQFQCLVTRVFSNTVISRYFTFPLFQSRTWHEALYSTFCPSSLIAPNVENW